MNMQQIPILSGLLIARVIISALFVFFAIAQISSAQIAGPAMRLTKDADTDFLPEGGGDVTYTYKLENLGTAILDKVTIADDKCAKVEFIGGDNNNDNKLNTDEEWEYKCSMKLTKTTTNLVTARAFAGSAALTDVTSFTVEVNNAFASPSPKPSVTVVPKAPKTGGGGASAAIDFIDFISGAAWVFGIVSMLFYLRYRLR